MKHKCTTPILAMLFIVMGFKANAQSLLDQLNNEFPDQPVYEIATFKTTRIGLGHSIETRKKGALEFSLYSRSWNIPDFAGQRFLTDVVSLRYGLDYAFSDNITFGVGYTNHDKITDGFLKYKLFKQTKSPKKGLFSVTFLQTISHRNIENTSGTIYNQTSNSENRYAFTSQFLIARKINTDISLQIAPTFIHRDKNEWSEDPNNQFAIAFGGRHKISNHAAIVSEYHYVLNPLTSIDTYNSFMVGVNWELGDLLLQFQMTNARNFVEDTFITQTRNNFNAKDGNFHFGFNATFVLHTQKRKL